MIVSLPCRCGGHGSRGHGRSDHPFCDRERYPRLVSNLSNTTLAASVSRLPPAPFFFDDDDDENPPHHRVAPLPPLALRNNYQLFSEEI